MFCCSCLLWWVCQNGWGCRNAAVSSICTSLINTASILKATDLAIRPTRNLAFMSDSSKYKVIHRLQHEENVSVSFRNLRVPCYAISRGSFGFEHSRHLLHIPVTDNGGQLRPWTLCVPLFVRHVLARLTGPNHVKGVVCEPDIQQLSFQSEELPSKPQTPCSGHP